MSILSWLRPRRRPRTDWQLLVDNLALAAAIEWNRPPRRWVADFPYAARTIADHYYTAVLVGNLNIDAVDGELFALEAALDEIGA